MKLLYHHYHLLEKNCEFDVVPNRPNHNSLSQVRSSEVVKPTLPFLHLNLQTSAIKPLTGKHKNKDGDDNNNNNNKNNSNHKNKHKANITT